MQDLQTRAIDLRHLGHERLICAYLLGDVLIDCGPSTCAQTLFEALGDARPRVLALTHVHLDHSGAAGTLVERWPGLEVWVHERGAPHLIDPSRLLKSATRLYGEDMERLWGEVLAVPEGNVRTLRGGELLDSLEVSYTPGHASHHVCYLDRRSRTAFVGDVAGVRVAPSGYVHPPTPPPDIDVEVWRESVARLRAWRPRRLAITHYGLFEDVDAQLDTLEYALERAAGLARELPVEQFVAVLGAEIEADEVARDAGAYTLGVPLEASYAGLARYWSRREVTP